MDLFDAAGIVGAGLYLASYALLSTDRISANGAKYIGMNLAAAVCMLISLTANWNAPSFFVQVCWVIFSLNGLFNCYKTQNQQRSVQLATLGTATPNGTFVSPAN
ncbi:hypothetical protein BCF53_103362 [Reinekea marinisedimentorum]|uniref:CBU-0592-like domain-containing protein n=1 Tax=Reinekea marinisedimentorum TaxID=230495 RepID=A0A4R3I8S7_9GAMM|nr:hypothetical protein BCF53_103362 [Reinekea marinisedimentorum]